jgi:hypothetical protein
MEERRIIIESHRKHILHLRDIEKQIEKLLSANDPQWRDLEDGRSLLQGEVELLIKQYWQWIPAVELSRCPFCKETLGLRFDSCDLNGFWWMDRTQRPHDEPKPCEHFCLLSGAVNLNGLGVSGGLFPCKPGPDKPFIFPRVLQMYTMVVVITEVPMTCGYTAYPIAYFSKQPVKSQSLTQSWARKEHSFTLDSGKSGWDIREDKQDFDLKFWVGSNKIFIYREGEIMPLKEGDRILELKGTGKNQTIIDNQLSYESYAEK